ncbi:wall-associated receptor kinase-like 20 [Typha angustifolia]|uniref:wall-associated receptor kinase-like 20 n=1 Tax=Typha angustifolia TaxID=59011 RepID=UPI003C2F7C08
MPTLFLLFFVFFLTPPSSADSACKPSCGGLSLHYPFGSGPGCGSPAFHPHVACNATRQLLTFSTQSGTYPIQSIDYTNQLLILSDPSMSTCSATSPSSGFSLTWDAPFAFSDTDIFALLECDAASASNSTLCDTTNSPVCGLLYTCDAIKDLGAPVSTCCIYTPVSLGPSFEMDLEKLKCSSYSGIYGFNGNEGYPKGWEFGIALKYRFSVDDGYPSSCAECEKSNGVCGYSGQYHSFLCSCANGMNTSSNCYFQSDSWSRGRRILPFKTGPWFISSWLAMAWILLQL